MNTPMKPFAHEASTIADQAADSASSAIRSTQGVANAAFDHLSNQVDNARDQAIPLINRLSYDYAYIPEEYKCWLSFETFRGLLLALLVVYSIPLLSIAFIYICIIRYVRQNTHLKQRQEANKRDVLILQRIVFLLLFIVAIVVPTVIILFIYIISR